MTERGWVEATGATVDDAIDEVLDLLDLDEDDAEIEVVTPPRGEGAGARPARVRARPRPGIDVAVAADAAEEDDEEFDEAPSDEELVEAATSFVEGLLAALELSGRVEAEVDDDGVLRVEVKGQDLAVLIGRRGRTLQGLAELVRTVVQRQTGGRGRIFVDVEGYRAKRRAALSEYAERLARRVVQSGVEIALEPMMAGDRKVVHDSVNPIAGAVTFSEGEEPRRYVVISPESGSRRR